MIWRRGEEIAHNPRKLIGDVDTIPDPDFSPYTLTDYLNPAPVLPVLASRGCKWARCRFCAHNATYTGGYRSIHAPLVADKLARHQTRYGARHFYFADLYVDVPILRGLSEELLTRKLKVNFHILGKPTAEHSPELFELSARAGLRWVSWGVESGSQRLLDVVAKGTRPEEIEKVLADARAAGISNLAMMIFGIPTSTDEDLARTLDFLSRIHGDISAMTASSFALFSTSPFGRHPEKYNLKAHAPQEEVRINGLPVHATRVDFSEIATDGTLRPSRGPIEVAAWNKRRRWLGDVPFLEGVPCEHYLIFVSGRQSLAVTPPSSPPKPRKAA